MSRSDGPLLVLGVGNELLGDDGVGVGVVHALRDLAGRGEIDLPAGTALVDGGTLGPGLLPWLADARAVLVVDAADLDGPPGSVAVRRGRAIDAADPHDGPSIHDAGVGAMLDTARVAGVLPDAVALVGIRPDDIDVGVGLSDAVRAAMPAIIETTVEELHRLDAITRLPAGRLPAGRQVARRSVTDHATVGATPCD